MTDAKFYDVDVGFNKELAKFNDIKTIPRVQIIKDGEIKENFIFKTSKSMIDNIEKYSWGGILWPISTFPKMFKKNLNFKNEKQE